MSAPQKREINRQSQMNVLNAYVKIHLLFFSFCRLFCAICFYRWQIREPTCVCKSAKKARQTKNNLSTKLEQKTFFSIHSKRDFPNFQFCCHIFSTVHKRDSFGIYQYQVLCPLLRKEGAHHISNRYFSLIEREREREKEPTSNFLLFFPSS